MEERNPLWSIQRVPRLSVSSQYTLLAADLCAGLLAVWLWWLGWWWWMRLWPSHADDPIIICKRNNTIYMVQQVEKCDCIFIAVPALLLVSPGAAKAFIGQFREERRILWGAVDVGHLGGKRAQENVCRRQSSIYENVHHSHIQKKNTKNKKERRETETDHERDLKKCGAEERCPCPPYRHTTTTNLGSKEKHYKRLAKKARRKKWMDESDELWIMWQMFCDDRIQ